MIFHCQNKTHLDANIAGKHGFSTPHPKTGRKKRALHAHTHTQRKNDVYICIHLITSKNTSPIIPISSHFQVRLTMVSPSRLLSRHTGVLQLLGAAALQLFPYKGGTPWLVYQGKSPFKIDDLGIFWGGKSVKIPQTP